jgi:hypothetical protein
VDVCRRRADLVARGSLLAVALVIVGPAFLPGRILSPAANLFTAFPWESIAPGPVVPHPATADVTNLVHPMLVHAAREVGAGRLPSWNPYQYAGAPLLSNPNAAVLSPLTALAYVLPLAPAIALAAWLKLAAAGLGMHWLLRLLGVGPLPATLGAVGFLASSSMIGWLLWTQAATIALIPWVLGVVERLRQTADRRLVAALALVVAVDVLGGYPQTTFHTLLLAGAWALARAPGGGGPAFLARAAAGVALGAGLAAAQILPFLDYARESAIYAYRSQWTFPLHAPAATLVTFLMPGFYGTGAEFWGPWQFVITVTFVGLVPIAAFPLALLDAGRRPAVRFFAGAAVVVAGIHYGAPGLGALALLPGMDLGNNLRLMPFLALAASALGALGLDAAARGAGTASAWPARLARAWFVVLAVAGLAAVAVHAGEPGAAGMVFTLPQQYLVFLGTLTLVTLALLAWLAEPGGARWAPLLLALQLASVLPLAITYNEAVDRRWFYPVPPAIAWLEARAGADARVVLPHSTGAVYRLREAHGYDGMTPRRVEEVVGTVGTGLPLTRGLRQNPVVLHGSEPLSALAVVTSPALDRLGVRYVTMPPRAAPPRPDLTLAYDGPDARIFVNPRALPRARVVGRARCADDRTGLRLVREGGVDPRAEVVLAGCAVPPVPAAGTGAEGAGGGRARILEDEGNRLRVAVEAPAPAYLVLTDTWFPGWEARVDGQPAPILRADHAFRAVVVPAGPSEVEFRFRPRGFVPGLLLGGLAAAVSAWTARPRRRDVPR